MPIDQTPLFRARVKMIRTQEAARLKRAQKQQQDVDSPLSTYSEQVDLNQSLSQESLNINFLAYMAEALRIRQNLTSLRDMVINGRREYVSDIGHPKRLIASYTNSMNEWERDELDANVEKRMRDCIQSIQSLQRKISNDSSLRARDEGPHLFEVLRILGKYLNGIAKIVAEMRALRTKKVTNMRRTCRLATLAQLYSLKKQKEEMLLQQAANTDSLKTISLKADNSASALSDSIIFGKEGLRKRGGAQILSPKDEETKKSEQDGWLDAEVPDLHKEEQTEDVPSLDDLDNDERAQLMAENDRLYSRSLQVDSDIQKLEKQMTELHRLQETFAEKVSEQDKDICFVNETTILTAENIRAGNEQIRLAIQNMASRRVILLFCIIVLTFTLLFLDWYNP